LTAPHPDDINYFRQRYGGSYSEIKKLLRHGYYYPVYIPDISESLQMLQEHQDDFDGYAVILTSRHWWKKTVIWFNDPQKATMAKMIAG